MGTLRGGTTIAGFPAIHSGMQEAIFLGNVTIKGYLTLGKASSIRSEYNNAEVINDHNNGNISMSAVGGDLYMGYRNTGIIRLNSNLSSSSGTTVIDTGGKLYYQGENTDTRYVRSGVDSYVYGDTTGTTAYPRIMFKNSGATNVSYFRTPTGGMLPYSNGTAFVGTTAWRFKEMHAVDYYEDGTKLSSKYASSSHSHSDYVTKNGDRMTGALEISGSTNDASRISVYSTSTNPRNGGSIELLETGPSYGATNSNGFRIRYDGYDNALTVDSTYTSETRHLTIKRNGDMTVHTAATFDSNITATGNITNGYASFLSGSIRFGPSNKGYMGTNNSGWVFYGNSVSGTYARFHDNGRIEFNGVLAGSSAEFDEHFNVQKSGTNTGYWSVLSTTREVLFRVNYTGTGTTIPKGGLTVSEGHIEGRMSHSGNYGYIHPYSAAAYGADNSNLRYFYAGSGTSTTSANRNQLRISTQGNNAVPTRITMDGKTVPVVSYGTGGPPSTTGYRNGDIYIQY